MAEFVGYRQERMLPEYEQMKKKQIFTDEEMRTIMKKRETYEYRISCQSKSMKDYCEYITYERSLLTMIAEREPNRNTQKMTPLEYSIANHIKSLYKEALSLFPDEPRLWENFIKFCKYSKFISDVSTAFEKMLQFHGDKPLVWLRAAMWEYNETHNMEKVKDFFLRGLQRHPENADLHLKFFKIMLTETANMSREINLQNNTESEQTLGLERVIVIYKSSKKKIHSINYLVELLKITEEYPFTKILQKLIVEDMSNYFARDEIMWHTLAQRELRGFHTADLKDDLFPPEEKVSGDKDASSNGSESVFQTQGFLKRTLKRRIELCFNVYEAAVRELKTEKMWSLFINAMLELNQDMSTQQVLKRNKLAMAFKGAHESGCMSENHYYSYIELLRHSSSEEEYILQVMEKATTLHSSSVKLWELWMHYHIVQNKEDKVYEVFRKAVKKLASEAYPLWRIILQYYQTRFDLYHKVEEIFSEAVKQTSPSFLSFRPQFVEWNAINKTIDQTRKLYHELVQLPPPCLELHQRMALLESQQLKPEINEWRKCHEYATQYFGKQRTDVWINYIKFERDHGETKNMSVMFERAKNSLDTNLVDNFIYEHSLLSTGLM